MKRIRDACCKSGTASTRHCADARKLHTRMGAHGPCTNDQELCTDTCTPGPSVVLAVNLLKYRIASKTLTSSVRQTCPAFAANRGVLHHGASPTLA